MKYIFKRKDIIISIFILGCVYPITKFINVFFEKRISEIEDEIEKNEEKKFLLKELKKIRRELNLQGSYFSIQDAQNMLEMIISILKKYPQIRTSFITPGGTFPKDEFFEKIGLIVNLKASFFELIKFLETLENYNFYINVDQLLLSKTEGPFLDVNLKLSTIRFKKELLKR